MKKGNSGIKADMGRFPKSEWFENLICHVDMIFLASFPNPKWLASMRFIIINWSFETSSYRTPFLSTKNGRNDLSFVKPLPEVFSVIFSNQQSYLNEYPKV